MCTGDAVAAPLDTHFFGEVCLRFDDSRFDEDLWGLRIEVVDEDFGGVEVSGDVFEDERIGTRIDVDGAAAAQERGDVGLEIGGGGVVDGDEANFERFQTLADLGGLEQSLFFGSERFGFRNPNHAAFVAHAQIMHAQDDIEGLIEWYTFER